MMDEDLELNTALINLKEKLAKELEEINKTLYNGKSVFWPFL